MKQQTVAQVWPTMLTPFTKDGKVDYAGLERLTNWYIDNGVDGLFAVCQSSEMFKLSLEERVGVARFVCNAAKGRARVITSGHVSDSFEDQVREIGGLAQTGAEAVILVTNRLANEDESDDIWIRNLEKLLKEIPQDVKLGFYECPYPYKRLLSEKTLRFCAECGRFYFLKDTCCDAELIRRRIEITRGSKLRIYNANSATLLETLKAGVHGYSGVMANFQPSLYVWLAKNWNIDPEKARLVSNFLSVSSLIETQVYPVCGKYNLMLEKVLDNCVCRTRDASEMGETVKLQIVQLRELTRHFAKEFLT